MTNQVEIAMETPSGHVWHLTAEYRVCDAEPDVGIPRDWVEVERLYWTKTGKELSRSAYKRIPQCRWDAIGDQVQEIVLG
ncbi:MAG: hypothetical protein OXT06_09185 [Rhodospirillaceae bacterium]|nr:hypothetical protein [Rhodospirillaceae bacterium]